MRDNKERNVKREYILDSWEYQICIGEIDKRNALINPSLTPNSILPTLYINTIAKIPKMAEGSLVHVGVNLHTIK